MTMTKKPPTKGAFDYLLDGNSIHVGETPPPMRGGGPQRIRVEIEVNHRQPRKESRGGSLFFLLLLVLLLLAVGARGEERWQRNRVGSQTYWNSDDGVRGQSWTMPDGSVRSTWQDPSGHVTNCTEQKFGNKLTLSCQ